MRWRRFLPPVAWAALIFVVSSLSNPPGASPQEWRSYAAHLGEYAILGFLLARALDGAVRPRGLAFTAAWALAAGYGLSDEWHQSFVPGRNASALDALADAAGAGAGVLAFALVRRSARTAR